MRKVGLKRLLLLVALLLGSSISSVSMAGNPASQEWVKDWVPTWAKDWIPKNIPIGPKGDKGDPGPPGFGMKSYKVGDPYPDPKDSTNKIGTVFYVYDSPVGHPDEGVHGLIAANEDQSNSIAWGSLKTTTNATLGDKDNKGVGSGSVNTSRIIGVQGYDMSDKSYAAMLCANYVVTLRNVTYSGWYLPSLWELDQMLINKGNIGGFTADDYWSSNERDENTAVTKKMDEFGTEKPFSKLESAKVRAVRAF